MDISYRGKRHRGASCPRQRTKTIQGPEKEKKTVAGKKAAKK
jgi:hypothetical protein